VELAKEFLERHRKHASPEVVSVVPVGDIASEPVGSSTPSAIPDLSDNAPLGNHHEHGETSAPR
jgi:hypothetical protein